VPRHLDRLTPIDASFLHQEGPNAHMHLGGLIVVERPLPSFDALLEHIRARLHLVPRYRQKLAHTAIDRGRPVWVDDPGFTVEYHVRRTALPSPGSWEQLQELTARIFSEALDREKPLWELWLVEGLQDGRCAIVSKTHHSMVDGIGGIDILSALFDVTPETTPPDTARAPWRPHPEPGAVELVAAFASGAVRAEAKLLGALAGALTNPERALALAREGAEGLGEIVWALLNPAPATPLNVEIGPYRRFVGIRSDLEDFRLIKNTFGGTVNDVVLSVVAGALRSFLIARGARTEGMELRALVPVSVRTSRERGDAGNRIVAIRGTLPVYIADPLERLRYVSEAMAGLKESKQALGAKVIAGAQGFAPPTLLAEASRLQFSTRLFNLIVTNVPGPQFPLYLLGCRLEHAYPIAFLPRYHALAIAIMSYNGEMNFSLLGDFDAVPDIDRVAADLAGERDTLVALAREQAPQAPRRAGARRKAGTSDRGAQPARSGKTRGREPARRATTSEKAASGRAASGKTDGTAGPTRTPRRPASRARRARAVATR
jgi:diacylglycerol O-acyltransferase